MPRASSGAVKVPVVLQMSTVECGAACLSMVLQAHEIPATLADCRKHLAPGPNGVNAMSLSEVALKFGLRARAYSAKTRSAVEELSLPAIVHFGKNHFVVLEGWSRWRDRVSVVDPAEGRRRLGWSEFLERHSGVALAFEPSSAPPTLVPQPPRPLRDFVRQLLRLPDVRRLAVQLLAAALFLHLLSLAFPLAAASLVDGTATSDPRQMVNVLGAGVASLVLALIVLGHLRVRLLVFFGSRVAALMALGSFQQVLALPPAFSDPRASDDSTRHLLNRARQVVAGHAVSTIVDGLWVLMPPLALLVIAPSFCGIVMAAAGLQVVLLLGHQSSLAGRSGRMLAPGAGPSGRALDLLDFLTLERADPTRAASWRSPVLAAVRAAALLLLLWVGTQMVLRQQMTLGAVLAAMCLATQFLWPLASLVSAGQRLRSMGPHIHALGLALEERSKQLASEEVGDPLSSTDDGRGAALSS